jgi:hypothetical protein
LPKQVGLLDALDDQSIVDPDIVEEVGFEKTPELKFVVTNTLIVGDIQRSAAFCRDILGATVLREGEPTFLRLGNLWLTINGGGGPHRRQA